MQKYSVVSEILHFSAANILKTKTLHSSLAAWKIVLCV